MEILASHADIIASYKINQWDVEPDSSRFKIEIRFRDGSLLTVKDYVFQDGRKYAFYYRAGRGAFIIPAFSSEYCLEALGHGRIAGIYVRKGVEWHLNSSALFGDRTAEAFKIL